MFFMFKAFYRFGFVSVLEKLRKQFHLHSAWGKSSDKNLQTGQRKALERFDERGSPD